VRIQTADPWHLKCQIPRQTTDFNGILDRSEERLLTVPIGALNWSPFWLSAGEIFTLC
jgi:hypothetical protein